MKLSTGNTKLGRIVNWNLPVVTTCRHPSPWCFEHCYAKKGRYGFPNTQNLYRENYQASKRENFADLMRAMLLKAKAEVVRVHCSGDFYDQAYLDEWLEIARTLPDLNFFAFTKSYDLDFSLRPENFTIRESTDITRFPRTGLPEAFTGEQNLMKLFPCRHLQDGTQCTECRFCFETEKGVWFTPH